jgi:hypothetical protein
MFILPNFAVMRSEMKNEENGRRTDPKLGLRRRLNFWYEWIFPGSFVAVGFVFIANLYITFLGSDPISEALGDLTNYHPYVMAGISGAIVGLLIGTLQLRISANRKSSYLLALEWWFVIPISSIIWSISSYVGTLLSYSIGYIVYTKIGDVGVVIGVFSWPVTIWTIGVTIQGIYVLLLFPFLRSSV